MTTTTDRRPYTTHENCDHDDTKNARRRCRNAVRKALKEANDKEVRKVAAEVDLTGRSKLLKDDLVYILSFDPELRTRFASDEEDAPTIEDFRHEEGTCGDCDNEAEGCAAAQDELAAATA